MAKTVVGLFNDTTIAQAAVRDLLNANFERDDIETFGPDRGGDGDHDFVDRLSDAGVPDDDARVYNRRLTSGGSLVIVYADDDRADTAANILNRHNPVDIDAEMRTMGEMTREGTRGETVRGTESRSRDETRIPIVEETMDVGKREVTKGTARVHTGVTERPVEEKITLRDEEIDVERRRVDRPASEADLKAFDEKTIEITQKGEEPVISKGARVVEEVIVGKDIKEHEETVRGTVRRTDVDIEGAEGRFRKHFDRTYAGKGDTYDSYRSAYRFGHELHQDNQFASKDWNSVQPEARRRWEQTYPDSPWDKIKDAVREGFSTSERERVTDFTR